MYCNDASIHLRWNDTDELSMRLLVPESPGIRSFFVICYADADFFRHTAVYLVEVHGLRSEYMRVCVGQSIEKPIYLQTGVVLDSKTIRIYTSEPGKVVSERSVDPDPKYGAKFYVTVTTTRTGTSTARIHAIDPLTRRRLACFLLVIASDPPDVKMAHDVNLPLNHTVKKRIVYRNEVGRELRYVVSSSDPSLLTVQSSELSIPPYDTRYIDLLFHGHPATQTYSTQVFLFIMSQDRTIQETRLLKLAYT